MDDNSKINSSKEDNKFSSNSNKKKKSLVSGIIHVFAGFNNTIVSISDHSGNIVCWSSAGKQGFKGSRKSTPYAAQIATQHVVSIAKDYGMQNAEVEIRGPGVGREASLRAIQSASINVTLVRDVTYLPHNGCRSPKSRRV